MALKTWYFNHKRLVEYVQEKAKEGERGLWEVTEELDRLAYSPDKMLHLIRDAVIHYRLETLNTSVST
jgi:hypothetical protein